MIYSSSESRIGSNIGNNFNPLGSFFNGSMDQLIIWNRELTPAEILTACDADNTLKAKTIAETNIFQEAIIYPNHTVDQCNIKIGGDFTKYEMIVYDLLGNIIMSETYLNTNEITFNIKDLESQVYIIELINGTQKWYSRITKL
jgi:hypothetical protein